MLTEQELEDITTERIEQERATEIILKIEIETLKKAVEKVENVSGFPGV